MPKLSIIIPVYNVEKYLRKCLDSVLAQTFKDFELILINDASTDNSQLIIDEYKRKDSRIISIINKENSGQGKTRNIGLGMVNGDYVTFVDSDDWIEKEMYQEMLGMMINNQVDLVECNIRRADKNDLYIKNLISCSKKNITTSKYINHLIKNELVVMVWNKIYKIEIIKNFKIKFFEERKACHEDLLFNISYMRHVNFLITINKPFYNYNLVSGSISQGINNYSNKINIKVINYFIENNKNFSNFKKDFISFSSIILPVLMRPTIGIILNTRDFKKGAINEIKKIRKNKLTFNVVKNCFNNKDSPFKYKVVCLLIILKMYYTLIFIYLALKKLKAISLR